MAKWDRIFRIAVVLLLSANLAVSSIICVRLADKAPVESSGKKESATEIADADHDIALILPESPTAADAWYDLIGPTKPRIMWRSSVWGQPDPIGILK